VCSAVLRSRRGPWSLTRRTRCWTRSSLLYIY
jgi:hypothetical protein